MTEEYPFESKLTEEQIESVLELLLTSRTKRNNNQ